MDPERLEPQQYSSLLCPFRIWHSLTLVMSEAEQHHFEV